MRKFYSKQLGQTIYDESGDCNVGCTMHGLGNVRYFKGRSDGMGNVEYFPGSMGAFDPLAAISDAVKQALPNAGQDVINAFLQSSDGQQLATQVESTAASVGAQAAAAQAASTIAQNQAYYQQQINALTTKIKANWQTILLIGGGIAALGLVIYMMKNRRSPAAANPRRRRK